MEEEMVQSWRHESVSLRALEALAYGVSWARLPGGQIQYCNTEFERLFGYGRDHFQTARQFVDEVYLHEQQRRAILDQWHHFEMPDDTVVVPDIEIDVMARDGTMRRCFTRA